MRHELFLYVISSPYGIDWSSPRQLAFSSLKNQFNLKGHPIGHVHVEFRKTHADGKIERTLTGMIQKNKAEERTLIFLKNYGLEVLFHDFNGAIENSNEITTEVETRLKKNQIRFIHFDISSDAFERIQNYLSEYIQNGCHHHYGLPNRPLYKEGGGCTAFGMSFFEVAGLQQEEFKINWTRTIKAPASLLKNCPFPKIIFHKTATRWALPHEPGKEVFFWDPDLMYSWIDQTANETNQSKYKVEKLSNSLGLYLDCSKFLIPNESIWKK